MAKTVETLIKEAESGEPTIKKVAKIGNSLSLNLTGYVKETEYYSVVKKGDRIILDKIVLPMV